MLNIFHLKFFPEFKFTYSLVIWFSQTDAGAIYYIFVNGLSTSFLHVYVSVLLKFIICLPCKGAICSVELVSTVSCFRCIGRHGKVRAKIMRTLVQNKIMWVG